MVRAVDGVSFTVDRGEVLAIVGESGSGKSVTGLTLMGLTRGPNAVTGRPSSMARSCSASDAEMRQIRGKDIAMIFQDPMTSLNPVYPIGDQIVEQIRATTRDRQGRRDGTAVELMERVGIPRAGRAASLVPARVLRRHASAGDDRDGALVLARSS